jgi:hypothetical protein
MNGTTNSSRGTGAATTDRFDARRSHAVEAGHRGTIERAGGRA